MEMSLIRSKKRFSNRPTTRFRNFLKKFFKYEKNMNQTIVVRSNYGFIDNSGMLSQKIYAAFNKNGVFLGPNGISTWPIARFNNSLLKPFRGVKCASILLYKFASDN